MNREIMLMRHGQPAGVNRNRVSARQMKEWIDHYNRSEIDRQPIPQASVQLAATARVVVSSTAPRALSSVLALGLQPQLVDAVFCEAQLPWANWKRPRLSPFTWAFILRLLWLWGRSGGVETATTASMRATQAARKLQSMAVAGPVLLLGHGVMNRMIARQLVKDGSVRQQLSGSQYWSVAVYRHESI